jgi:propanol-preferring alcohol dehydrogenase
MRAMALHEIGAPLALVERDDPVPGPGEVALRVSACAVCRTDLHIVDGDLPAPALPRVPGHQIVGRVLRAGDGVRGLPPGARVGVPWLGATCGACRFCASARENLCDDPTYTGYTRDGGFATHVVVDARYCFDLPEREGGLADVQLAPLLCGGLIGYRALRLAGDARRVGLYGFGNAAHILLQILVHAGREGLAFTRPGDDEAQALARELGASWAGGSDERPPQPLDAAILFAPVGALVPAALRAVDKGGVVVCAGIHMSDIPSFPYRDLWQERTLRSVANLTRADGDELLALASAARVRTEVTTFPLERANDALDALRAGDITGAAVIEIE